MTKTITLLASGTRGDVQPYLALGIGLRDAGYAVRVATHKNFVAQVEQYRLSPAALADNPSDLFARPGGEDALRFSGNWGRNLRATLQYWRDAQPVLERLLVSAWEACQGSDVIVIGLPTIWGAHITEALGIPCIRCLLQPITATGVFPSPLLPSTFSLGRTYNRLTHWVVSQVLWQSWRGVINRWRHTTLRLGRAPFFNRDCDALTLYGFSPHVVPRPADWHSHHIITGYWVLPLTSDWTPPPDLVRFLDAGSPPVYIGFGSMAIGRPRETLTMLTCALAATGLRAVLMQSPHSLNAPLPPTILPIAGVPHAWLFPQMAAVVHHGGAGTTGTSLRAGTPTVITPYAVDQFFWGARVAALGAGPKPIPLHALMADELAQALRQATQDFEIKLRAQLLARAMAKEDGVLRAVEAIRAWS